MEDSFSSGTFRKPDDAFIPEFRSLIEGLDNFHLHCSEAEKGEGTVKFFGFSLIVRLLVSQFLKVRYS
jgi:hypothetical protein